MTNKSKHREAFEEFAERAEEELGDSLKRLVLFGSVARSAETEGSDVDVFAVVESGEEKSRLHEVAFEVEVEYDVVISLIIKDEGSFRDQRESSFIQEVMETGEVVV